MIRGGGLTKPKVRSGHPRPLVGSLLQVDLPLIKVWQTSSVTQPTQMAIPLLMEIFLNSWSLQCGVIEGMKLTITIKGVDLES